MQDSSAQHHLRPAACFAHFLATGFYSGKSPIMPGTAGTLAAALLFFALQTIFPLLELFWWRAGFAVAVTALGLIVTEIALRAGIYGADADDPQEIVIDEFAGYAVTLLGCPSTFRGYLIGFILFRLFDMTKPPPVRQFEKLPGAAGIVFDDIVAGIIAALLAGVLFRFI